MLKTGTINSYQYNVKSQTVKKTTKMSQFGTINSYQYNVKSNTVKSDKNVEHRNHKFIKVTAAVRLSGSLFIYKASPRAPRELPGSSPIDAAKNL